MTQPQWATTTIGMLVGLGIARLLTCCAAVVRSRDISRPDWIPLAWAASIFLLELHGWWEMQDEIQAIGTWSFPVFLALLLSPLLLYFAAVMVLPVNELRAGENYREIFDRHGHWALMPLSAYYLEMVCENLLFWNGQPFDAWAVTHFALAALPLVAFFCSRPIHGAVATLYLMVQVYFIFVY